MKNGSDQELKAEEYFCSSGVNEPFVSMKIAEYMRAHGALREQIAYVEIGAFARKFPKTVACVPIRRSLQRMGPTIKVVPAGQETQ